MGSVPTQVLKADLNGTGTLVTITSYVVGNRFDHRYGRTDWTSPTQPAGTLTVTLENLDGRFTPGSTTEYDRGVVKNMCVEWTCGARVRRFYVDTAEMIFPTGVGGNAQVALVCKDALGFLAGREMQAIVRETTLSGNPVAYWPLDESVSDGVQFADISGRKNPSLRPFTKETSAQPVWAIEDGYHSGGGRGPRTDGSGALILNGNATSPIRIGETIAPFSHRGGVRNTVATNDAQPLPLLNRNLTIPDQPAYFWSGGGTAPTLTTYRTSGWTSSNGSAISYVVSGWFSIKDIYGAAVGGGSATDGPFVILYSIEMQGGEGGSWSLMWRIADRKLCIAGEAGISVLSASSYSVSPTDVHHIAIVMQHKEDVYSGGYVPTNAVIKGYVDGVALTADAVDLGGPQLPIGITVGSYVGVAPTRTGADQSLYALSGTVSNLSIHGPDQVVSSAWSLADDIYATGTTGPLESPAQRWERLAGLATGLPITIDAASQGTPQDFSIGPQDTRGKDALTAICEALACDEASFTTGVVAGSDVVTAWLDTEQRELTPTVTIDAQNDASATPELGFDMSGVAAAVTVKGWNQSVTYQDSDALAQWLGSSVSLNCPVADDDDLARLAEYRTVKGRAAQVTPTVVTVNAAASAANLTTSLLNLYPGATVRVTNMPSGKVGYTQVDCICVGVTERHGLGFNDFRLSLIPRVPEAYFDPLTGADGPWVYLDSPPWRVHSISGLLVGAGSWSGQFMRVAGTANGAQLNSSATTVYFISNLAMPAFDEHNGIPTTFLSTDVADYPMYVQVDNEIMYLPNAAAAPVSTNLGAGAQAAWSQTVTGVVRGQQGTSAATHGSLTASTWNTSPLTQEQHITVVVPASEQPNFAF